MKESQLNLKKILKVKVKKLITCNTARPYNVTGIIDLTSIYSL